MTTLERFSLIKCCNQHDSVLDQLQKYETNEKPQFTSRIIQKFNLKNNKSTWPNWQALKVNKTVNSNSCPKSGVGHAALCPRPPGLLRGPGGGGVMHRGPAEGASGHGGALQRATWRQLSNQMISI